MGFFGSLPLAITPELLRTWFDEGSCWVCFKQSGATGAVGPGCWALPGERSASDRLLQQDSYPAGMSTFQQCNCQELNVQKKSKVLWKMSFRPSLLANKGLNATEI